VDGEGLLGRLDEGGLGNRGGPLSRGSVEQATVDQALAWESGDHPAQLRRLVSEGRSRLERAVRARALDTGT